MYIQILLTRYIKKKENTSILCYLKYKKSLTTFFEMLHLYQCQVSVYSVNYSRGMRQNILKPSS